MRLVRDCLSLVMYFESLVMCCERVVNLSQGLEIYVKN